MFCGSYIKIVPRFHWVSNDSQFDWTSDTDSEVLIGYELDNIQLASYWVLFKD